MITSIGSPILVIGELESLQTERPRTPLEPRFLDIRVRLPDRMGGECCHGRTGPLSEGVSTPQDHMQRSRSHLSEPLEGWLEKVGRRKRWRSSSESRCRIQAAGNPVPGGRPDHLPLSNIDHP